MKTPKLRWKESLGEGNIVFPPEFDEEHFVDKADALMDWIYILKLKYQEVLDQEHLERANT